MEWITLVSRVAHILAAIALAGGAFYMRGVLVPSLGTLSGESVDQFTEAIRRRWAKIVMASALVLIASGFYNLVGIILLVREGSATLPGYYHPLIGIKVLLAFFIFYVASMLAGRTAAAGRYRERAPLWMKLNLAAAAALITIAGALHVPSKSEQPEEETMQPAPLFEGIPPVE